LSNSSFHLYQLQKVDLRLDHLNQRLEKIASLLSYNPKLTAALDSVNASQGAIRQKEAELAALEQIRRGSLCPQIFEATRKDGTKVQRGPYILYTYKDKGKTRSRRITDPEQVVHYQHQIEAFRRFEALAAELVQIGEKISDLVLSDGEELKKKRSRRGKA